MQRTNRLIAFLRACFLLAIVITSGIFRDARADDRTTKMRDALPAGEPDKPLEQDALKKFQGDWECESAAINGVKVKIGGDIEDVVQDSTISKDQWMIRSVGGKSKLLARIALKGTEKSGDIIFTTPNDDKKVFGIYRMDGDQLTLCINIEEGDRRRPEGFFSMPNEKRGLIVYNRKKK